MEPYYEGDDVLKQFKVLEGLRPLNPQSAYATVYYRKEEIIPQSVADIKGNTVSFLVKGEHTRDRRGDWRVVFEVYITPDQKRTHVTFFRILPKGAVISKKRDAELTEGIDEKSSMHEVDNAFGLVLRGLRKASTTLLKAANQASDMIAKKSNRKMPQDRFTDKEDDY